MKSAARHTTQSGIVLSTSRRSVTILTSQFEIILGHLSTKNLEVTVGDAVDYTISRDKPFVEKMHDPRNCLSRSYFGQVRRIVANVDHLFVGAAIPPLFNTSFVDRLLALARLEGIPTTLLVNKIDLGLTAASQLTQIYERLGVDILYTSARSGEGIEALRHRLEDPCLQLTVLAGISGVGKSTILNQLIPEAKQRVGEVSEKTGQGRQTTAQPIGHLYQRAGTTPLIVVDLPGIQSFGVEHLDPRLIKAGFAEIEEIGQQCEYSDCSHTKEDTCAVKAAVVSGQIAESRYQSYCGILAEIDAAKAY